MPLRHKRVSPLVRSCAHSAASPLFAVETLEQRCLLSATSPTDAEMISAITHMSPAARRAVGVIEYNYPDFQAKLDADLAALGVDPIPAVPGSLSDPAFGKSRHHHPRPHKTFLYHARPKHHHRKTGPTAPTVSAAFYYDTLPNTLTFTFDQDVTATDWNSALTIIDLNTGTTLPATGVYSPTSRAVVYTLNNGLSLPDANFAAVLHGSLISSPSTGLHLAGSDTVSGHDFSAPFFFMNADFTRDHQVSLADFSVLSSHYNTVSGATFSQGDANYDGKVLLGDYNILQDEFGAYFPVLTSPSTPTVTPLSASSVSLSWPAVPDISSYDLYRFDPSGAFQLFPNLATPTYTDTTASPGVTYSYFAVSRDPSSNSSYAGPETVITRSGATIQPIPNQSFTENTLAFPPTTTFSDPNTQSWHTAQILWNDGSSTPATISESNGSGTITPQQKFFHAGITHGTLYLTDQAGAVSVSDFGVTITSASDVQFSVTTANATGVAGSSFNADVYITDPNPNESWTIDVNWGDNTSPGEMTTNGTPAHLSHTYTLPGDYSVQTTATEGLDPQLSAGPYFSSAHIVALAAPTHVAVSANSPTTANLTWQPAPGADSYNVYRLDPGASAYTLLPAVTTNSLLDSGLAPGAAYSYYIKSVNSGGLSAASPTVSLRFPPAVATGLAVASVTSTTVSLTWNPSAGATNYVVFRKGPNDSSFLPLTIGGTGTEATDTGLTPRATYYYKVRAGNTSDNSALSDAIPATPFLPIPTNLAVTNTTSTTVSLSWSPSSEATGYYILRKDPGQSTFTQIGSTTGHSSTFFRDNIPLVNSTYTYEVEAFTALTNSDPSNSVSATPTLTAPTNLNATAFESIIHLTWSSSPQAAGYAVFRLDPGGTVFHQVGTPTFPIFDDTVSDDSTYSYYVLATVSTGNSTTSNQATATTPLAPPTNLTATATSDSEINLTWSDNSAHETGYGIERSDDQVNWNNLTLTSANTTQFTDSGLTPSHRYFYRVRAIDGSVSTTPTPTAYAQLPYRAPTIVDAAAADQSTVTSKTDSLSVLADNPNGPETDLTYFWSVASGPAATFAPNGINAAKNTTVTFPSAGDYTLLVTVQIAQVSVTSSVHVTVQPATTSIKISSRDSSVSPWNTEQFTASAIDQFGNDLSPQPPFNWSVADTSLGSIDASGLFTARDKQGTSTITATADGVSGTAPLLVSGGVVVNFDNLAPGAVVSSQYPQLTFSTDATLAAPTVQAPGYSSSNALAVQPSHFVQSIPALTITFTTPVDHLTFDVIVGDDDLGASGTVQVFTYDGSTATIPLAPTQYTQLLDLTAYPKITKLVINSAPDTEDETPGPGDGMGLWYDNFRFTPAAPDLDVDSANANGLNPNFARSLTDNATDLIEDNPTLPGKRIQVDNGDSDQDGIPDFADGFSSPAVTDTLNSATSDGSHFTPLVLELPDTIDPSAATLRLIYNASNPDTDVSVSDDGTFTINGSGVLRIWTKDGNVVRDRHDVAHGGDFVDSNVTYTAAQLGIGSDRKVTLWAEALKPSVTMADIRVVASLDLDGPGPLGFDSSDAVRLSAFSVEMDQVNPDGSLTPADGLAVSNPSPTISLGSFTVDHIHASADFTQIVGDAHFTGSVHDLASNLIPGDDGTIQTLDVYFGESATPIATIDLEVHKSPGSNSLADPYDFSATFDATLTDIPLQPGWNPFRLQAANAYGYCGTLDVSADVDAEPPPDDNIDVQLTFSDDPYLNSTDGVTIAGTFTDNGVPSTVTYSRSAANPMIFVSPDGGSIDLGDNSQIFHAGQPDERIITITNPQLPLTDEPVVFDKTDNNSNILAGSISFTGEDRPDYRNYTITLSGTSDPLASGGGLICPFVFKVDGPDSLLAELQNFTISGKDFPTGLSPDGTGRLALDTNTLLPAEFIYIPTSDSGPFPAPNPGLTLAGVSQYTGGVVVGFFQGGVDMVTGIVHLAKAIPSAVSTTYHYLQNAAVRYVDGDNFEQERSIASKSLQTIEIAAAIIHEVVVNNQQVITAIYTGDYQPLNDLSPELRLAVESTVEIFNNLGDQYAALSPYEQGKIVGQVLFQVVSLIGGPELLALGKSALIAKLSTLQVFQDGGMLAAALAKSQALSAKVEAAFTLVGVVKGSPLAKKFEGLFDLYRHLKSAEGLAPWPALQKTLSLTADAAAKSEDIDSALTVLCDAAMPEIYRSAINADGSVNLNMVPTYKTLKDASNGRIEDAGMQKHHAAVQTWVKRMFQNASIGAPTQTELDTMPAIAIRTQLHEGRDGTAAFHAILRDAVRRNPRTDTASILDNLEEAYKTWSPTDGPIYWKVASEWLNSHGIHR